MNYKTFLLLLIFAVNELLSLSNAFGTDETCNPKHLRVAPGSPASSSMTISYTLNFKSGGVTSCKPYLMLGTDNEDGIAMFDRIVRVDGSSDVRQVGLVLPYMKCI